MAIFSYMGEYFNSAHIHVMRMFPYDQECWGKIFGVQCVADNFIFHVNLSSCPSLLITCSGPSVGLELPIARPVMVEFLRPDESESGGCWSRWWTSLPDSDSSPFSTIPVVYRAGFVYYARKYFFSCCTHRGHTPHPSGASGILISKQHRVFSLCRA